MNKPTRGQWRGYALLSLILAVLLLVVLVRPRHTSAIELSDHSPLEEAIVQYGDSIEAASAEQRQQWRDSHYRPHRPAYSRSDSTWKHSDRAPLYTRKANPLQPVDINSADTAALQQLYGIGPAFALRIVKYRNLLGGFTRKEQLLEVYGMDAERYNGFADHVTVDRSKVRKIDINTATVDQLKRHPYLDYYQARAIVDYRKQGVVYRNAEDLLKVNLIDDATLTKLEGYIQYK